MKAPSFLLACGAVAALVLGAARDAPAVQVLAPHPAPVLDAGAPTRIEWDAGTLVRVAGGTYGRMIRLRSGDILCSYEAGGKSWTVRSRDGGRSWGEPNLVKAIEGAAAANPELLQLRSGRLLLFYNQRPRAPGGLDRQMDQEPLRFGIGVHHSDDGGLTWRSDKPLVFLAGPRAEEGCWEPAGIQLPSGEVQLFFANEAPYDKSHEQEITRLRSRDNGQSWSAPEKVAFRAGHRDGMPIPLLLASGELLLAIEDNGLAPGNALQPAILSLGRGELSLPSVSGASARRWSAATPALGAGVYAGAPYIKQMPGGATILSCQSNAGGRDQPAMTVYVGDSQARNFAGASLPFANPSGVAGSWNSLFVKDARTITALSETVVNGQHGLWAIDGRLVYPEPAQPSR